MDGPSPHSALGECAIVEPAAETMALFLSLKGFTYIQTAVTLYCSGDQEAAK